MPLLCELIQNTHEPREKRVKLELGLLREAFELGEISAVHWIPTKSQLADCLTKENAAAEDTLRNILYNGSAQSVEYGYIRSKTEKGQRRQI